MTTPVTPTSAAPAAPVRRAAPPAMAPIAPRRAFALDHRIAGAFAGVAAEKSPEPATLIAGVMTGGGRCVICGGDVAASWAKIELADLDCQPRVCRACADPYADRRRSSGRYVNWGRHGSRSRYVPAPKLPPCPVAPWRDREVFQTTSAAAGAEFCSTCGLWVRGPGGLRSHNSGASHRTVEWIMAQMQAGRVVYRGSQTLVEFLLRIWSPIPAVGADAHPHPAMITYRMLDGFLGERRPHYSTDARILSFSPAVWQGLLDQLATLPPMPDMDKLDCAARRVEWLTRWLTASVIAGGILRQVYTRAPHAGSAMLLWGTIPDGHYNLWNKWNTQVESAMVVAARERVAAMLGEVSYGLLREKWQPVLDYAAKIDAEILAASHANNPTPA